jgi:hypothetical protein
MGYCNHEIGRGFSMKRCKRAAKHRGEHTCTVAEAARADDLDFREDLLAELHRLNASISAIPPVLNAIAGASFMGPHGQPLTLADLAEEAEGDGHA